MEVSKLGVPVLIIYICLTVPAVFGNCFVIFATNRKQTKLSTPGLLVIFLASSNLLYMIFRDFTRIIPLAINNCYPMSLPCKFVVMIMHMAMKISVWTTLLLSLFWLTKLKNVPRAPFLILKRDFILKVTMSILCMFWTTAYIPFLTLPSEDNSLNENLCVCSVNMMTDSYKGWLQTYRIYYFSYAEYLVILLMVGVNLYIIWVLLKQRQALFADNQCKRLALSHRKISTVKVILGLVLLYTLCWGFLAIMQNVSDLLGLILGQIGSVLYPTISPYIIGLGYPNIRYQFQDISRWMRCTPKRNNKILVISGNGQNMETV